MFQKLPVDQVALNRCFALPFGIQADVSLTYILFPVESTGAGTTEPQIEANGLPASLPPSRTYEQITSMTFNRGTFPCMPPSHCAPVSFSPVPNPKPHLQWDGDTIGGGTMGQKGTGMGIQ